MECEPVTVADKAPYCTDADAVLVPPLGPSVTVYVLAVHAKTIDGLSPSRTMDFVCVGTL